jgi:hypothetical protein
MIYGAKHGNDQKEVILYYEGFDAEPKFCERLAQELGKEIYVFSVQKQGVHAISPPPWIEIAFIFSSSAIATAFLAKLGEDIYAKIKDFAGAAYKKRQASLEAPDRPGPEPGQIKATIVILVEGQPGIVIQGRVNGDAGAVAEAIGVSQIMLEDSLKLSGFPVAAEYRTTREGRQAIRFLYDYDPSNSEWTLSGVRLGSPEKEIERYRNL